MSSCVIIIIPGIYVVGPCWRCVVSTVAAVHDDCCGEYGIAHFDANRHSQQFPMAVVTHRESGVRDAPGDVFSMLDVANESPDV